MNLELTKENEINLLIKYNLTPEELLFIQLIYEYKDDYYTNLEKFVTECNTSDIQTILQSLKDKGIILSSYKIPSKGSIFNPKDVKFNSTVEKQFIQHSEYLGRDLFDHYPISININGTDYSLRNIAKKYDSMTDFGRAYGKIIKWNLNKHEEILEILEWAKENYLITSGITDFVISEKWQDLKQMRDNGLGTFKTTTLI